MDYFKIKGGKSLNGSVEIRGAKNSILELMPATILTDEPVILHNVPCLSDIETLIQLLENFGSKIEWNKDTHTLVIHTPNITNIKAPYDIVKKMRASIYVLGALMGRCGEAKVSAPGGCVIGQRPVNIHLEALEALGANIEIHHGYIVGNAPVQENGKKRLVGGKINGRVRVQNGVNITTHGGTVNAIEAAVLAKGETVIEYASVEPEVDDLINMLNSMGAKITREKKDGIDIIRIEGVEKLHGTEYSVMPDRLEAGTYAIAGIITKGVVEIKNADVSTMTCVIDKLKEAGAKITITESGFIADGRDVDLKAVNIDVEQYPGFPTDMQSQFMALMTVANGTSLLKETLFENRLMYVPELVRMGANIEILGDSLARFKGVKQLYAADVMASDLRSGAALTLAGLVADGETILHRVYHIYRGYENFVENLSALGADIEVLKEDVS
ncbi:MAG: UDP-N-acetylglucosamine 1-carboxyvinyltransferase [bacterium]|nr:UDP-N-acetylglucosamine 1-carboxyvinyltransferase [bacterium]